MSAIVRQRPSRPVIRRSLGTSWRWLRSRGMELLFPGSCNCCGNDTDGERLPTSLLCCSCREELVSLRPACARCGLSLPSEQPSANGCAECRDKTLRFDRVVRLGEYEGPLRHAVLKIKEVAGQPLAKSLAHTFMEQRESELAALSAEVVVPIPLHWFRRWQRGHNSPEALADVLAQGLKLPVAHFLLKRVRHTRPQSDLPPGQRFENVRGAFRSPLHRDLPGAKVLLVDDILTTGATCSEAARVLRSAGAAKVFVAVLARATG